MSRKVKPQKPLRAFAVTEHDEGAGGIVFARHAVVARRQGACEYSSGDFDMVRCVRAPWADQFAETGVVPIADMIDAGWHFECGGCGRRIDSDMLYERDLEPADLVGTQDTVAYCNAVCEAREQLYRAEAKHLERRWIRRFRKFIKLRFPDAVLVGNGTGERFGGEHAYARKDRGHWRIEELSVQFEFPGMAIAPASLRYRRDGWRYKGQPRASKLHFEVCAGDKTVFEAWAAVSRSPQGVTDQAA